jgi:hypothetical protein
MEFYICVHRADSYLGDCMPTDLKTLVTGLYDLREPADPSERKKALKAAMAMLGDDTAVTDQKPAKQTDDEGDGDEGDDGSEYPIKARQWMKRYDVTEEHINNVFHVEKGSAEVVAHEAPGSSGKQKTINAYVLTGISQLIATGDPKFDDKAARAVCKSMGCLDESNHTYNMKGKGNLLGGSKDSGWTLTSPGLKSGAELVKGLSSS